MIVLLVLAVFIYGFITFCGMLIGGWAAWWSGRNKKKHRLQQESQPQNVLEPPDPKDWKTLLSGWDGKDDLEIEEI